MRHGGVESVLSFILLPLSFRVAVILDAATTDHEQDHGGFPV
jgi:hypothetical protein